MNELSEAFDEIDSTIKKTESLIVSLFDVLREKMKVYDLLLNNGEYEINTHFPSCYSSDGMMRVRFISVYKKEKIERKIFFKTVEEEKTIELLKYKFYVKGNIPYIYREESNLVCSENLEEVFDFISTLNQYIETVKARISVYNDISDAFKELTKE